MEVKAKLNYLRIAPRKVRLVTDLIKGMDVGQAENHLKFISKRSTKPILKLLHSAIVNAENNFKLLKDSLYIKKIIVNEGAPFKRWRPVSRGRTFPIMKRTSNINLILGIKEGGAVKITKDKTEAKIEEVKTEAIDKKSSTFKARAPKKILKGSKIGGLTKKIFRRKSF
ncbi:MAG: 50S ribosomal protein L22 [Candidatus Portnoybacteria bacterium RBG_13_40_8]|uniref:Large ribosomal subunit protein uL22 n=1 Tax=Candidatus Portnoybacteria bacterium RBG_13_40_8 TaxID=1801990 RepID=A0A1G2F4B6_9BACT|nr:MAG: 50S ribosomal protein L22 [Candidatus Portnoybacteria bacterium RBG_13_40_8]OGZ35563.1 MAG: 50S ribosomal protein L22 [Candidatus Portnoybacteria bacterium RIFCSPHIGHO2_01_FULL_39_19]